MAKQISELGSAGAVTPLSDLLWIEQSGLPKKITPSALIGSSAAPATPNFVRYTQTVLVPAGGALTEILDEDGNSYASPDVGELLVRVYVPGTGTDTGLVGAFYSDTSVWTAVTHYASGVSSNHPRIGLDGSGFPAVGHYHASSYTLAIEVIRCTNRSTFSTDEVAWRAAGQNGLTAFGWGDHASGGYAPVASPTFTTKINTPYMEATDLGPNADPGVDDLYVGGYGIMGDRSQTVYITNFHATGTVTIGVNGAHNANPIAVFSGTQITANKAIVGADAVAGTLSATGSGSVVRAGAYVSVSRLFSSAAFALACNAYSDPGDAVSGQMRTAVTHGSYGHTIFEGAGGVFYWYGATGSVTAGNVVTKSLSMQLSATGRLTTQERIYPDGNGTGYIDSPTLRGSINVAGAEAGSYAGYSIDNQVMWMKSGGTYGLYDEVTNAWRIQTTTAVSYLDLFYGTVAECRTHNSNASDGHSGLTVLDYGQTYRQVGFVDMEEVGFAANTVVGRDHWHKCLVQTGATTRTLTFNTAGDVLNGVVLWVKAEGGNVTLVDDTMVLTWYNGGGGTLPVGNRTLTKGGWCTVHKTGNSTADVTGVGLS